MRTKHLLYIVFSLFLLAGCKDDIQTVQFSTAVQDGNEITLKWTPSDMSGFKYYRIMRADDGLHFNTINNVDSVGSDAFDKNICTYTDSNFPYVDSVYYKIIAFGDEIISSPNLCVHINKPITISENISNAYVMPDEKKILVFGYNGSSSYMYLYDYVTNKLINKMRLDVYSSGSTVFFGKYNNKYEFYFFDSWNDKIEIYNGLTLTKITDMSYWGNYPMFATNNNGTIYSNDESSYTYLINRKNLTTTTYQGATYIEKLYYMNVNNKLLGTTSYYNKVVVYALGDTGNITSEYIKNISYSSNPVYVENSNLIYCGNNGIKKIINTDTWQENTLPFPDNVDNEFMYLYSAKNVIYACTGYENKLYCYSMTDFKLIKTINLRFVPTKLLSDSNYLFFCGYYNGSYIIDKIKLVE
jgi:hypothetical protein